MKMNEHYKILREIIGDFIDTGKMYREIVEELHVSYHCQEGQKSKKGWGKP